MIISNFFPSKLYIKKIHIINFSKRSISDIENGV